MGNCIFQQADSTLVASNKRINKLLKEEEKKLKTEVKLLLLGNLKISFKNKIFLLVRFKN